MKKIINDPADYVDEALVGLMAAYPDTYTLAPGTARVVVRTHAKDRGKVGVVSGGGSGHFPLFAGYVGTGMLDTCAVGDVFAGPAGADVQAALRSADQGAGVLAVIGNYGGDRMTFEMQVGYLQETETPAGMVVVNDDVASAPSDQTENRRGVAGLVPVMKVAGAAAEDGMSLPEVKRVAEKAIDATHSIGVATRACVIPMVGKPTFELDDSSIEMGMGIHGEQGVWRGPLRPADALADEMFDRVTEDAPLRKHDDIAVFCNSLGATPIEELLILYRRISVRLSQSGVTVHRARVGHLATSMEMAGASITFMRLDGELQSLLDAPSACPFWNAFP